MSICPLTTADIQIASAQHNCTQTLVYHCLRDQFGQLTQKCIQPSWIQAGLCAEFNTVAHRLDAKACSTTRGICPQKAYLSNEVISYSACAPEQHKTVSVLMTTQSPKQDESDPKWILILMFVILSMVAIVAIIIFIYIWRRRKNETNRNKSNDGKKEEEHGLVDYKKEEIREHLQREAKELEFFNEVAKYVPVHDTKIVQKAITESSHVVLVGKPGSGKTSLAWNLCKSFHGQRLGNYDWIIKVSKREIEEIRLGEDDKMILLLDNYLESASKVAAEKKLKALDDAYHDMLANYRIILILTMNHYDFSRLSKILPDTFKVLEIGKSLNTIEMGNILEAHGITFHENKEYKTVKEKQFLEAKEIVKKEESFFNKSVPIGFPLIISLAAANGSFLTSFVSFSKNPVDFIFNSVWQLRKSVNPDDRNRFCTIIYAALHGGKINTNKLDRDLFTTIAQTHKIMNVSPNADHYLLQSKGNGIWEFYHDVPLRIVLSGYGREQPDILVTKCPSHVLLRYCIPKQGSDDDRMFGIVLENKDNVKEFFIRVVNENEDIENHRMFEDTKNLVHFTQMSKKSSLKGNLLV